MIDGVKAGSWLHRQLTTWNKLSDGQQALLTRLGLTPDQTPLYAREMTSDEALPRTRRTFEQTATLLRAFVERHGRTPRAREWIEADGQRVMIGPWLCKARTKQRTGQLAEKHSQLMREILHDDWTAQPEKEDTDLSEIP